MAKLILKPGREKSLLRRHPWVFSGAVAQVRGEPEAGATVEIRTADGQFLAWGAYSPRSQIVARVWSWRENAPLGPDLLRERLVRALSARARLLPEVQTVRLVHAESDGLPGVIADRYADTVVLQLSSAGAEAWRETLADLLLELSAAQRVYERSDAEVLALEGMQPRVGPLCGDPPPDPLAIEEDGLKFSVSIASGHKTGFYLDQRDNRRLVRSLGAGAAVLDCFCYTGGFTINALAGGASHVTAVEASSEALALARQNLALNALAAERCDWVEGDVFQILRRLRDQGRRFDLIVLDPPKFAPTAALAERAARGYKDINLLAFKLLTPGGLLATFSCSGGVSRELFQKIVAGAALDAGVDAQILRHLSAGVDHPVALNFPEGEYLKGLLCRIT
jgi:23S rRNA (cytosine1962-C5)-methyltransferase